MLISTRESAPSSHDEEACSRVSHATDINCHQYWWKIISGAHCIDIIMSCHDEKACSRVSHATDTFTFERKMTHHIIITIGVLKKTSLECVVYSKIIEHLCLILIEMSSN